MDYKPIYYLSVLCSSPPLIRNVCFLSPVILKTGKKPRKNVQHYRKTLHLTPHNAICFPLVSFSNPENLIRLKSPFECRCGFDNKTKMYPPLRENFCPYLSLGSSSIEEAKNLDDCLEVWNTVGRQFLMSHLGFFSAESVQPATYFSTQCRCVFVYPVLDTFSQQNVHEREREKKLHEPGEISAMSVYLYN